MGNDIEMLKTDMKEDYTYRWGNEYAKYRLLEEEIGHSEYMIKQEE